MEYTSNKKNNKILLSLLEPRDKLNDKLKETILKSIEELKKENKRVPISYENGVILLDVKEYEEGKEVLISKMRKNEYMDENRKDDIKTISLLRTICNKLPSFKKYKEEDDVRYIIKNHRILINELMEHRMGKSLESLKGDLTLILRILKLSYGTKENELYIKYTTIQSDIRDVLNITVDDNKLTEREKGQYLEWNIIMKERYNIEENYKNIKKKNTSYGYKINQDVVLISLYTLTPVLRREIAKFKFTISKPSERGDWVYFHKDGKVSLELYEIKKKHNYISIPLNYREEGDDSKLSKELLKNQSKLSEILKDSYSNYKRINVFTDLKSDLLKEKGLTSVSTRLVNMFKKYGISMGVNTLRKSYVSYRLSLYQHSINERKYIAELMRTSVKYIDSNYNKIIPKREIKEEDILLLEKKNEEKYEVHKEKLKEKYKQEKEEEVEYEGVNGNIIKGTKASKYKMEQYKKRVKKEGYSNYEYRRRRYINDYKNGNIKKESIKDDTLKKYKLSKYGENGEILEELRLIE